jgi:beta-lactamase regulating signal transducer with metallopeptidase domain
MTFLTVGGAGATALLVQTAWKGALLASVLLVAGRLLRRAPAATRDLVWSAGSVALLLVPLAVASPVHVQLPAALYPAGVAEREATVSAPEATAVGPVPASFHVAPSAGRIALGVWLLGFTVLGTRLILSWRVATRLVTRGRALAGGAWEEAYDRATARIPPRRPVRLVESDETRLPITTGLLRPTVVLPRSARPWSRQRLEAVLLHELAHVHRGDLLLHVIDRLVCALHWFNPLVWMVSRRARAARERACDDAVLAAGVRPSSYAGDLLDIVRASGRSRTPAAALAFGRESEFEARILAILDPTRGRRGPSLVAAAAIVLAVAGVALPLAAFRPHAPTEQSETGNPEALRAVMDATADGDPAVRLSAVWALMEWADPASLPALLDALSDPSPDVRAMAARAIGELTLSEVPAALVAATADPEPTVRRMALWAVGEIR